MKKKTVRIALLAVVAAVAGYGAYQAQMEDEMVSDLALANVEALAAGEDGWNCRIDLDYTHYCNYYDYGSLCPCGF